MNARLSALVILLVFTFGYTVSVFAEEPVTSVDMLTQNERWIIKRQVMSRSGVMYDMANLTDSGYRWKNDVLWEGSVLPANEKWYIVGFFFERPRYKGVWLQYAIQFDENTKELAAFKRWYGTGSFR